jgi:hypothetical protein
MNMNTAIQKTNAYDLPTPPGELLERALESLEGATAENFRERIEFAADCIQNVKDTIESRVLICGETSLESERQKKENES